MEFTSLETSLISSFLCIVIVSKSPVGERLKMQTCIHLPLHDSKNIVSQFYVHTTHTIFSEFYFLSYEIEQTLAIHTESSATSYCFIDILFSTRASGIINQNTMHLPRVLNSVTPVPPSRQSGSYQNAEFFPNGRHVHEEPIISLFSVDASRFL
jgi:hypothetical protein